MSEQLVDIPRPPFTESHFLFLSWVGGARHSGTSFKLAKVNLVRLAKVNLVRLAKVIYIGASDFDVLLAYGYLRN